MSAAEISPWGAVLVVVGVATGVLMIVSGAGLLKRRGGNYVFKKNAGNILEAHAPKRYSGVLIPRRKGGNER